MRFADIIDIVLNKGDRLSVTRLKVLSLRGERSLLLSGHVKGNTILRCGTIVQVVLDGVEIDDASVESRFLTVLLFNYVLYMVY